MLSDDGVIAISVDENEVTNLRKMLDEIYGINNFVSLITVIVKPEGRRYGYFAKTHEYLMVYAKNMNTAVINEIEVEGADFSYHDSIGGFNLKGLRNRNVQAFNSTNRPNLRYPFYADILHPDDNGLLKVSVNALSDWEMVEASTIDGLKSVWRWGKEKSEKQANDLVAYKGNDGLIRIFQKERKLSQTAKTVWDNKEFISNKGTKELQDLLGKGIFDFPKPVALLNQIVHIGMNDSDIVLDFFSGSATMAQALLTENSLDNGLRKFIMVQLPEICDDKSEAKKAGYNTICDIGEERIRRAGKKIKEEAGLLADNLDIGFRVFKIDDSNMKDVYYKPDELDQNALFKVADNIKEDRTPEDLLFQVMIDDFGIPLSAKIEKITVSGKTIFNVENNFLVACFDSGVTDEVVTAMAKLEPKYAVLRDRSYDDDSVAANFEQIFNKYSPTTTKKIL